MLLVSDVGHVGVAAPSRWLRWHERLDGYHEIAEALTDAGKRSPGPAA